MFLPTSVVVVLLLLLFWLNDVYISVFGYPCQVAVVLLKLPTTKKAQEPLIARSLISVSLSPWQANGSDYAQVMNEPSRAQNK